MPRGKMSNEKLLELRRKRKELALKLRRRLRELRLTQDRAAEMVGVGKRTMEYWLAGHGPIRKAALKLFGWDESTASFAVTPTP